jgi:hypothetical protein
MKIQQEISLYRGQYGRFQISKIRTKMDAVKSGVRMACEGILGAFCTDQVG